MNKSEKEALSSLVSDMLYSNNSSREVVSRAQELINMFPCIQEGVKQHYAVEMTNNIVDLLCSHFTKRCQTQSLFGETDSFWYTLTQDSNFTIWEVVDAYICNKNVDLFELNDILADSNNYRSSPVINTLVVDSEWKKCCSFYCDYDIDSVLYKYLTGHYFGKGDSLTLVNGLPQ